MNDGSKRASAFAPVRCRVSQIVGEGMQRPAWRDDEQHNPTRCEKIRRPLHGAAFPRRDGRRDECRRRRWIY
jgi:hypothetical protein